MLLLLQDEINQSIDICDTDLTISVNIINRVRRVGGEQVVNQGIDISDGNFAIQVHVTHNLVDNRLDMDK